MSIDQMLDREYEKYNVIKAMANTIKESKITSLRGSYFFLSNFYNSSVLFRGQIYQNAEAAFQATKCENKIDKMKFINISGKDAKKLGRRVKLREDWEEVKNQIMYEVVLEKFKQNSDLKIKLLRTGDKEIIEMNQWHDNIWGKCICSKCKDREGKNKLGKILMEVRKELREFA